MCQNIDSRLFTNQKYTLSTSEKYNTKTLSRNILNVSKCTLYFFIFNLSPISNCIPFKFKNKVVCENFNK